MKHILFFLIVLFLFASCKSSQPYVTSANKKIIVLRDNLVESAKEKLGTPYKFGGTTKNGLDCSGLVYTTFKKEEIVLPRTSIEMSKKGTQIKKEHAQKADLIFFKTGGSSKINHVGLVIENKNGDLKFIHSSTKKGVIISSLTEEYYLKTFSHITRLID